MCKLHDCSVISCDIIGTMVKAFSMTRLIVLILSHFLNSFLVGCDFCRLLIITFTISLNPDQDRYFVVYRP